MARPDVLYVKLKADSPFTVSRARIDNMVEYFQQDASFVTHFALARLSDEISQGKLNQATDIPVASRFLSAEQQSTLRQYVHEQYGSPELTTLPNPELDALLG